MVGQDRGNEREVSFYVPVELRAAARAVLVDEESNMTRYLIACLLLLVDDQKQAMRNVAGHWPPEKPKGRPRKTDLEGDHGQAPTDG